MDATVDGGVITNLQDIFWLAEGKGGTFFKAKDMELDNNGIGNDGVVMYPPAKVTHTTTISSGIPTDPFGVVNEVLGGQQDLLLCMILECVDMKGSEDLPPKLVTLAARVWINIGEERGVDPPSSILHWG